MRYATIKSWIAQRISRARFRLQQMSRGKRGVLFAFGVLFFLGFSLLVVSFMPSKAQLSYGSPTCTNTFTPLPALASAEGESVAVYTEKNLNIAGFSVWARSLCVSPQKLPVPGQEMSADVQLFNSSFLKKRVRVSVPEYPQPTQLAATHAPEYLSVQDDIELSFNQKDELFDYYLSGNDTAKLCKKQDVTLRCSLRELELLQAHEYEVGVLRVFQGEAIEEVDKRRIQTLDPLEVTASSVSDEETVYQELDEVTVSFNKPLQLDSIGTIQLKSDKGQSVTSDVQVNETELIIKPHEVLARETDFSLRLVDLQATDNSILAEPWELTFTTSGGPTLAEDNISTRRLPREHVFRLTFDQDLDQGLAVDELVSLTDGESALAFTARVDGDQLIVRPDAPLPLCGDVHIGIGGEIVSAYGISRDSTWRATARTTCKTTTTIGYSVQGKPIYAYTFGTGAKTVVYVGGMHGNEYSSVLLMDAWIEELDNQPQNIPDDHTLIIIPESSPDSVAARSRLNSRGVDLNRNFPTDNWQSEVQIPGPTVLPEGGGSQALSEPEAKALADFIRLRRPQLVLTYHAVASVVIGNDVGRANAFARDYARSAQYNFATNAELSQVFNYDATGAFEDWLHDELAIPALLVELATMSGDEIDRNREALWRTLTVL